MRRLIAILPLLVCASAVAQNEGQLQSEFRREGAEVAKDCSGFKTIFGCLQELVTGKPLHVTGGSIAPQNGESVGAAFVYDKNIGNKWRLNTNADAVVSTNASWRAGLYLKALYVPLKPLTPTTTKPPEGKKSIIQVQAVPELNFYVQSTSLNKLDYYGLGPLTAKQNLALFGMTETITGGNVIYPLPGNFGLALFGEINGRFVDIRDRHGDSSPSIEQLYSNTTAPGLARQPGFFQAGQGLRLNHGFSDRLYLQYSATFQEFAAVSDSRYSFQRLTFDLSNNFPLYRNMRRASLPVGPDQSPQSLEEPRRFVRNLEGSIGARILIVESFVPNGHVVPFYFQPTLGGTDINGNRGLSSYPDYRFRAPNLMLFRGTFEHSLWGPLGGILMADFGKVGLTRSDVDFKNIRHSYAAGLTIRAGGFPQLSLLVAWGGREGTHTIADINSSLLGGAARPSLY